MNEREEKKNREHYISSIKNKLSQLLKCKNLPLELNKVLQPFLLELSSISGEKEK